MRFFAASTSASLQIIVARFGANVYLAKTLKDRPNKTAHGAPWFFLITALNVV